MDGAPQGETPTRSEGRTRARSEGEARIRSGWAYSAGQGGDQAFRSATITAFVIIAATVFAMSILHGRPELLLVRVVETGCLMVGGAACVWAGMRERGAERAWRLLAGAMVLSLGVASGAIGRDIVFNHSGPIPRLTPATMLYLIPAGAGFAGLRCDGPDRPESARPSAPGRLGAPPHVSPLGRSPPPGVRGPEEPPPDPSNRDTVVGGPTLPGDLDHMSNHDPRAVSGI
ncbi:membrane hypothetical protein [Frankia sp. Hr75.2]|nr:membrane hypothetical protein [Frankia sp. Hr75.2]